MARLQDKVIIVTGSSSGFGRGIAKACAAEGAKIVVSDVHEKPNTGGFEADATLTTAETIEKAGGRAVYVNCDVTKSDEVANLVAETVKAFGRLDVMINNAGLGGTRSVLEMTDDEWSRVLDVTLNGTFRCTRAALKRLVEQGDGGAIVNNASVVGWRSQAGQAHYAAAKAAVMALTRCAAADVASHGIRVNAVAPSLAMHPFLAKVTGEELLAELAGREAFGRAAQPWEVANAMVFLASDYASYLTGEVLSVSSQHP